MTKEQLQSQTISFLRFPLIVLVVLIHVDLLTEPLAKEQEISKFSFTIFSNFSYLFSVAIANCAVPLFFLISGFLYFYKVEKWNKETYFNKTKKRISTLFTPYVFWSFFTLILVFIFQSISYFSALYSKFDIRVEDFGFVDFLNAFWNVPKTTAPFAYQFWFIRDLMILCLISPIIYFIIRYTKFAIVIVAGALFYMHIYGFIGLSYTGLLFFSLGAYFSINKLNIVEAANKLFVPSMILYPLILLLDLYTKYEMYSWYIRGLSTIIGVVFFINIVSYGLRKKKLHPSVFLANASFIVFAFHEPMLEIIARALTLVVKPDNHLSLFFYYIVPPFLVISLALLLYKILEKTAPKLLRIISGGR